MAAIRFRSRHLHATIVNHATLSLQSLGWIGPAPINFSTTPVTVLDYQPDERGQTIKTNTVAISLGDYDEDEDEELGAAIGGVRSAEYQVFFDCYMAEQALSLAITDDIRDLYMDLTIPLIDQINGAITDWLIEVQTVRGPERPSAQIGAENFKRFWRTMRVDCKLYFQT